MIMVPKTNALPLGYTPKIFNIENIIFKNTSTFKLIFHNIHTHTQI